MMKKLILDLDMLNTDFPSTKYDIGGLGHAIIIYTKDKRKAVDEMVQEYRDELWDGFKEVIDDDGNN